jgi:hypothetical protein
VLLVLLDPPPVPLTTLDPPVAVVETVVLDLPPALDELPVVVEPPVDDASSSPVVNSLPPHATASQRAAMQALGARIAVATA